MARSNRLISTCSLLYVFFAGFFFSGENNALALANQSAFCISYKQKSSKNKLS